MTDTMMMMLFGITLVSYAFSEVALVRTFVMNPGRITPAMIETFKTSLLTKTQRVKLDVTSDEQKQRAKMLKYLNKGLF